MQNAVADNIASFLKQYEPFHFIELDDLKSIVLDSTIITLQKESYFLKSMIHYMNPSISFTAA